MRVFPGLESNGGQCARRLLRRQYSWNAIFMTLKNTVGVSLLAMAVCHSTLMLTDTPPSRAGSLLQGVLRCF
ncbi:hypothetical protein DMX02_20225 [Pseudomonas jessenii]|nr:hypothetical protein DMX02_20225 [Pseudomonas jessenii]